jgi:hypothetical protein
VILHAGAPSEVPYDNDGGAHLRRVIDAGAISITHCRDTETLNSQISTLRTEILLSLET